MLSKAHTIQWGSGMPEAGTGGSGPLPFSFSFMHMNNFLAEMRGPFEGRTVCLAIADDSEHLANTKERLQQIMRQWDELLKRNNMNLRVLKTEYMAVKKEQEQRNITIHNNQIQKVDSVDMGNIITADIITEPEVKHRLSKFS